MLTDVTERLIDASKSKKWTFVEPTTEPLILYRLLHERSRHNHKSALPAVGGFSANLSVNVTDDKCPT